MRVTKLLCFIQDRAGLICTSSNDKTQEFFMQKSKNQNLELPKEGFVRLPQILAVIPISKSQFWLGVKNGRFPRPIKLGAKTTAWRVEDIRALILRLSQEAELHEIFEKNEE